MAPEQGCRANSRSVPYTPCPGSPLSTPHNSQTLLSYNSPCSGPHSRAPPSTPSKALLLQGRALAVGHTAQPVSSARSPPAQPQVRASESGGRQGNGPRTKPSDSRLGSRGVRPPGSRPGTKEAAPAPGAAGRGLPNPSAPGPGLRQRGGPGRAGPGRGARRH